MPKSMYNKEYAKIRRRLNRHCRRLARQILKSTRSASQIPAFKNTSGWVSW